MDVLASIYEAAANVGFLVTAVWTPSDGGPAVSAAVGWAAPDDTVLDGLAASTEYAMSYPTSTFAGLQAGELVEVGGSRYSVRDVRAVGDGSETRARLTRL